MKTQCFGGEYMGEVFDHMMKRYGVTDSWTLTVFPLFYLILLNEVQRDVKDYQADV